MNIKKWTNSLWSMLLGVTLLGGTLVSCQDDEFPSMGATAMNAFTRLDGGMGEGNGLVQQDDGYWKATRRVPLVGTGRVINNISNTFVDLGSYKSQADEYEQAANNLVDYDLVNTTFSPTNILDGNIALNQIVSILDLNYDYAGGQKAGFVIKNTKSGLLDVKVLTGLWLDTYLNGEATGERIAYTEATNLVDLGLGNIAGGNGLSVYTIEGTFSKPFDEIRLGASGIQLSVIQDIEIMYAYVGENPMIPAVNNGDALSTAYFNKNVTTPKGVSWAGGYQDVSLGKLIDGDLDNGITIELVSGVFQPRMTVDFGRKIPAGSEIGFYVTGGELAHIGLGSTTVLTTYNGETEAEKYSRTGVVDLKLLGGGVTVYSMITTEECDRAKIEFDGLNLKLGAIVVHYAFVREPTTIDVSSYFTLTNATVYNPIYRFADVPEGVTVKYDIVSHPSTADNIGIQTPSENGGIGYLLTGLTVAGNYVIKATYTDANNNTSEQTATITRMVKPKTDCNTPLINDEDAMPENAEYTAYVPERFNGIVIGGTGVKGDVSAVTDHNIDNSIQYTDASITLAQNQGIIGVKKNKGSIHTGGSTVRTGFVINNKSHLLGLDALRFMRIRLLNNNVPVSSELADENNGVSLSLIDETSNLVRLSIDTDEEFDAIELYTSGLIELKLGTNLSVYYAFIEDANQDCGNPGEECMQLITNANYGAMASIDTEGLLNIGGTVTNLGNMVDGNMDTYASIMKPVDVATATIITVTFNTIKKNQEVGFILSSITGLTNVDLIGIMKIKAFYNDNEVLDNTDGGLLNLKLIGNGDKSYISITPPEDFNKLQLIIGKGVGLLNTYQINGVYLRPDFDGDGVMDCVTDDTSTEITGLKVIPSDICLGDGVEFDVSGGVEGVTYTLVFIDKHSNKEVMKANVTINKSGGLDFINEDDFYNLPAGEYYISVEHGSRELNRITELTIHPKETTWEGTTDADWNKWDNWSEGTPWDCTNVFIPNTVENYPNLLTYSASKEYRCNNIHFASDAELIGQNRLHYTGKVFFDKTLEAGKYQLLSMPLQGMVTGDMFVASNVSEWETWRDTKDGSGHSGNYFLEINDNGTTDASNYKESRTNPLIYQRFWSKEVTNKSLTRASYSTDDAAIVAMNDWSRSFNAVGTPYALGQGFAVRIEGSGNYTFHFPKSHNIYHYFDKGGNSLNESDPTDRNGEIGHFIVESLPRSVQLSRETSGRFYLFGNPFMAHINIKKFLEANSEANSSVSSVKVYKDGQYVDITSSNVANGAQIAPMQAVFLETEAEGTSYSVNLTEDMLEQGNSSGALTRALPEQLELLVTASGHTASCFVTLSSTANDSYDSREDALLLVGNEEGSGVAVFTAADGKALSIQRMKSATRIPVGFYLKQTGNVSLTFDDSDNAWNGWKLKDEQTGRSYPLKGKITLDNVSTGSGRFFLEKVQ